MKKQEKINIVNEHLTRIFEEESKKCQKVPDFFIFDKNAFLEHCPKFKEMKQKYALVRNNSLLDKISKILGKLNFFKARYFARTNGFTNGKQITILLHDEDLSGDLKKRLYFFICTLYHEFRHVFQREMIKKKHILKDYITDFDSFRLLIESNCRREIPLVYKVEYSDFYSEIDASIYGEKMANKYCKKNLLFGFDDIFVSEHLRLLNYDFDKFLRIYNLLYRDPMYRVFNKESSNSTYSIFYDKIGNFKKLSNIIKNPMFHGLSQKLKYEMLTCTSFLSSITYELNALEKRYICDLVRAKLREKIDNYLKIREFFSDYRITDNEYLSSGLNMLTQIEYLINFYVHNMAINYSKEDDMNRISSLISSTIDYSNYESPDNRFNLCFNVNHFFNEDIRKNIYILDYFLADSNDYNEYVEMLSSVLLLKETFKRAIDVTTDNMDAEYEPVIDKENNRKR